MICSQQPLQVPAIRVDKDGVPLLLAMFGRLSAEEGALPDCWANVTKGDMLQVSGRSALV